MAIQLGGITKMEEVPEEMKEFVTQGDNGVFTYDNERAFKALKDEREISRSTKAALAPFKALNLTVDQIKQYVDLGKSPAEIAELIAKAACIRQPLFC